MALVKDYHCSALNRHMHLVQGTALGLLWLRFLHQLQVLAQSTLVSQLRPSRTHSLLLLLLILS